MIAQRSKIMYEHEKSNWLLPDVQGTGAGTKMSGYVKALQPAGKTGALVRYNDFAVKSLPPDPTAAGIRPGCCDMLASVMPAEIMRHTTGHDMKGISAMFEYTSTSTALTIPGSLVLSGWDPCEFARLSRGPVAPSLEVLTKAGITLESLEVFIDEIFGLHSGSPPMLKKDGSLRPLMHASLAKQLMYYEERFMANESQHVLNVLRDSFTVISVPRDDAHSIFIGWGKAIKAEFDRANLHLVGLERHSNGSDMVVAAVQQQGAMLGRILDAVSALNTRVAALEKVVGEKRPREDDALESTIPPSTRAIRVPSAAASSSAAAAATPAASPAAAAASTPAMSTCAAAATVLQFGASTPAAPPVVGLFGAVRKEQEAEYVMTDVLAEDFYLECLSRGGTLPPLSSQRKSRAQVCYDWCA